MKESDVSLIEEDLQFLSTQMEFASIKANFFLRPVRATSEIMAKYETFNGKMTCRRILIICALLFFSTFNQLLRFVYRILKYSAEYYEWEKTQSKNFEVVFLSHYNGEQIDNSSDIFFGPLPQIANNLGRKCVVLLINHSKNRRVSYLSQNEDSPKYILLPKSCSFPNAIKILTSQISSGIRMVKIGISNREFTARQRMLLIGAATYQLHAGTLSNLILWENLSDLLGENDIRNLFLTLEGHSYEALICENLRVEKREIQVSMYQQGPITLKQFGLSLLLQDTLTNIRVLTSGEVTKDFLLRKNPTLANSIFNIGSEKFQALEKKAKTSDALFHAKMSAKTILFAPEGVMGSTLKFLEIALQAADTLTELNFVFRIHPHLSRSEVRARLRTRNSIPTNFNFSSKNLEDDLTLSIACIYRSSAVAIQGLGFGVQPIFSDEGSGHGLDPIDSTLIPHKSFRESEELISILSQLLESWETDFTTQYNSWFEFQNSYYSRLDSKVLATLFER
jgi:hypothetical protein